MLNAFTIDVEDWFHILDLRPSPPLSAWSGFESRVEQNTEALLRLMSNAGVRSTCFLLGWIVETYPELAQRIAAEGHELASHGYAHELVYEIGEANFRADLERSFQWIGDVLGCTPSGYRAPGFSITEETPWAFDVLREMGFAYDSSLFPASRGHGGHRNTPRLPHRLKLEASGRRVDEASKAATTDMIEFPISVTRLLGRTVAYCGGGYLRFFPYALIKREIEKANARGEPVIVYIHPRDIDPDQPRLKMPLHRAFKSYVGLSSALPKLRRLLRDFRFGSVSDVLFEQGLLAKGDVV